jgi:hemerythrin-like domain-containing protein
MNYELTQTLVDEHKLIKRMIDILENAVNKLKINKEISPEIFKQATEFIRNFADKFHHAKEEEILFKEMIKKGMPEKESPIDVMLIEHEQGREFVKGMIKATEELEKGNKQAIPDIIKNAEGYIELLREHIEKEDEILYPLAEKTFDSKEKEEISHEFKQAEIEKGGEKTLKRYEDMVGSLENE